MCQHLGSLHSILEHLVWVLATVHFQPSFLLMCLGGGSYVFKQPWWLPSTSWFSLEVLSEVFNCILPPRPLSQALDCSPLLPFRPLHWACPTWTPVYPIPSLAMAPCLCQAKPLESSLSFLFTPRLASIPSANIYWCYPQNTAPIWLLLPLRWHSWRSRCNFLPTTSHHHNLPGLS